MVQQRNLALVEKVTPVAIEVINGWNFSLRPIMHETKALMVTLGHTVAKVFSMSSHLQQTLSSLNHHGSFFIILKWIRR
jgi:hypothetical protein